LSFLRRQESIFALKGLDARLREHDRLSPTTEKPWGDSLLEQVHTCYLSEKRTVIFGEIRKILEPWSVGSR